jgi:hypothetical protein
VAETFLLFFCGLDLFALLLWLKLFLLGERVMLALLSVLNEGDVVNPVAAVLQPCSCPESGLHSRHIGFYHTVA